MIGIDIVDRAAIRDDVTCKTPLVAQQFGEQKRVRAGGFAIDGIVSAHHGADVAFAHGGLEMRQIRFVKIPFRRLGIETMALGFGPLCTAKCLAQAIALMYFGSSPCKP